MFQSKDILLLGVVFASFVAGILLPGVGELFRPFILFFLMAILFLSFLTIGPADFHTLVRLRGGEVLRFSLLKMIVFPVVVYGFFRAFLPAYAPAALLLSAASTGVVAPFIAALVSANTALVLVVVVVTSISLPFSLPVLAKILLGQAVEVPLSAMIRTLALVVFLPFVAVRAVQRFLPAAVPPILRGRYALSLVIFAGTNLGVFSKYSDYFHHHPGTILEATLVSILLGGIHLGLGWFAQGNVAPEDRLAGVVSMVNVNNVLILVFASRFFGPLESAVAAFYLIPFFGLIVPLRVLKRHATGKLTGP